MRAARALILGCAGLTLGPDEIAFLTQTQPWGLILFRRNIANRAQVSALTAHFREIVGRPDAPVLVDQEGGRVQRLAPPEWSSYPAAARLGALASRPGENRSLAFITGRLIAHDLREIGINVDCDPVLDLPQPGSHSVIGDRAYGDDAMAIARLGRDKAEGLLAGGVVPVFKHVPGHGRAKADSHFELPVVDASLAELEASDFAPFRANADLPMAMTAHVVFRAIDPERPATLSPVVVERIIRGAIGFDGLLMSDDLSMKALSGSFAGRTQAMFAAGVDMALHCNGLLDEAAEVAGATPWLAGRALVRAEAALALILNPDVALQQDFNPVDARAELAAALAAMA